MDPANSIRWVETADDTVSHLDSWEMTLLDFTTLHPRE
jgi:hypothetical protein